MQGNPILGEVYKRVPFADSNKLSNVGYAAKYCAFKYGRWRGDVSTPYAQPGCVLAAAWLAFAAMENVQCSLQGGPESECSPAVATKIVSVKTGNTPLDRSSEVSNPPYTHNAIATLDGDPTAGFNGDPSLHVHSNWVSQSGKTENEWIVYDLGEMTVVTSIRISNRPAHGIKNVHVQVGQSKTEGEWVTVWSFQVPNQPGDTFLPPFIGGAPFIARWIRLYIVDAWTPSTGYNFMSFNEIEFYGCQNFSRDRLVTATSTLEEYKTCIKIVTADNSGTLDVFLDEASTYSIVGKSHSKGTVVIDKCFSDALNLDHIIVSNPSTDGWSGAISFSRDSGATYAVGMCTNCDYGDEASIIFFDGNSDQGYDTGCWNSRRCKIQMPATTTATATTTTRTETTTTSTATAIPPTSASTLTTATATALTTATATATSWKGSTDAVENSEESGSGAEDSFRRKEKKSAAVPVVVVLLLAIGSVALWWNIRRHRAKHEHHARRALARIEMDAIGAADLGMVQNPIARPSMSESTSGGRYHELSGDRSVEASDGSQTYYSTIAEPGTNDSNANYADVSDGPDTSHGAAAADYAALNENLPANATYGGSAMLNSVADYAEPSEILPASAFYEIHETPASVVPRMYAVPFEDGGADADGSTGNGVVYVPSSNA